MLAWVQDRLSGLIELHTSVAEGEWPGPGGHGDRARPALRLADSRFRAGLGVRGTRWDPRRSRARRTGRPCRQNGRLPSQASAEPDPFCRSSAFITGASSRSASCPEMNGSANGGISAGYPFARVRAASDPGAAAAHSGGSGRGYQRNLRDVSSQQTGGRLNMQPSGLMNISAWSAKSLKNRLDPIFGTPTLKQPETLGLYRDRDQPSVRRMGHRLPGPPGRRDRRPVTFDAHIIETGTQSYRLRTTKATSLAKNPARSTTRRGRNSRGGFSGAKPLDHTHARTASRADWRPGTRAWSGYRPKPRATISFWISVVPPILSGGRDMGSGANPSSA